MKRTRLVALLPVLLAALAAPAAVLAPPDARAAPPPPSKSKPRVLISGVYMHGYLPGIPDLDSAVRLVNLDPDAPADISGYALSDKYSPRKVRKGKSSKRPKMGDGIDLFDEDYSLDEDTDGKPRRGRPAEDRVVRFPPGTTIAPGGEIWVAATAKGFIQVFGQTPAFEALDTDPTIPDTEPARGFLWLNEGYGTVALLDRGDYAVDFVAWQRPEQDNFKDDSFDDVPWQDGPIALKDGAIYGWLGRVLRRATDELGRPMPDTDSAKDWPVGFSTTQLGEHPTHRIEMAGQSQFIAKPLRVRAKVLATSAPDNNYQALIDAFDSARRELRVRIYQFTHAKVAEALIRTKERGVDVILFLEGSPVGGIPDQERWLVDRIAKAGIPVHFLAGPPNSKLKPRYRFDHSKYVLVDDRRAIIGTENYGSTGVPAHNSFGNRGWMVHIENPQFVQQLRDVWDHDYRPGALADVISIDADPNDEYGLPYRDPAFVPSDKARHGDYHSPVRPLLVDDTMGLELVLSPDTSLNEGSSIIGMMQRAETSLYLEQNSILPFWRARRPAGDEELRRARGEWIPGLPLQAVVAAARRGVKVRVLLDGTWYNAEETDERDNDDTVRYLEQLARDEGLDIAAKVINLESTHLEKIHAKGIIVDEREVFIGSINWTENSFEGNREVGVIVSHPKVAGYYTDLFHRDWSQSRLYGAPLTASCDVRAAPDAKAKVIAKKPANARVDVVHERRGAPWVEVELGLGRTGWCEAGLLGTPEARPMETRYVIGRDAFVTGTVALVDPSPKVTRLKFQDAERPPFVAVIFERDAQKFIDANLPPKTTYEGKQVRLRGRVKTFNIPEIILTDPSQIEIIEARR